MSISQLEALYNAAVAALEAGDYATAIQKALACKMRLATTPDVEGQPEGGGSARRLEWANAAALDKFIAECKQLKSQAALVAGGGPFQQTQVIYDRPDISTDCYR